MKIRSVTYFDDPGFPLKDEFLQRADLFFRQAKHRFQSQDYEVQTTRFASPPSPSFSKVFPRQNLLPTLKI